MTWRKTTFDRPHIEVTVDPGWLLAPLFARELIDLPIETGHPGRLTDPPSHLETVISDGQDWPRWWQATCDYRPGTPAPRQSDLVAFSPALTSLWQRAEPLFDSWQVARRPSVSGSAEVDALARFEEDHGRAPAPVGLRVLVIPVRGSYWSAPEPGRLIVSAELRAAPDYRSALTALLPHHF